MLQQRTVVKKQANFTSFLTRTLLYPSSYINPDFAMAKACFKSLLQTAIKASFLLFPFATIRS